MAMFRQYMKTLSGDVARGGGSGGDAFDLNGQVIITIDTDWLAQIFRPRPMPQGVAPGANLSHEYFVDTVCCGA
ncbi:unannotated protein [freshwater metagenome]|uniref:Unannotated protein n=1 Tax=freshwater metagenome TaxID=449393 RepID=A0A6J7KJ98_9ZZZZ